jgi:hypothetical protein
VRSRFATAFAKFDRPYSWSFAPVPHILTPIPVQLTARYAFPLKLTVSPMICVHTVETSLPPLYSIAPVGK